MREITTDSFGTITVGRALRFRPATEPRVRLQFSRRRYLYRHLTLDQTLQLVNALLEEVRDQLISDEN